MTKFAPLPVKHLGSMKFVVDLDEPDRGPAILLGSYWVHPNNHTTQLPKVQRHDLHYGDYIVTNVVNVQRLAFIPTI